MAVKITKIACLLLAVFSIWFSLSFRGGKVTLKFGTWESIIHNSHAVLNLSEDSSGGDDSGESDFA